MSIVDGKGLVTWEGGLFEPNSDLLRRVQWAFGRIRADGGTIILNEAGRPFGEPTDMNVRNAWQTVSGVSTVWFQWGRYLRGETPSAANPNSGTLASEHTQGKAIDCNAPSVFDATLRAKYFHMVGMQQTISSESWHWAIRGASSVSLAGTTTATPIEEDELSKQAEDEIHAIWQWMGGGSASQTTEFYNIKQDLSKVKAVTDQIGAGQGPVHEKLDNLVWITNDSKKGIRQAVVGLGQAVAAIAAVLARIATKLGA